MNKICGIYKITSPTGKIYIGQSRDINKRKNQYKNNKGKGQIRLHRSIIKYGWNFHKFEIICECQEYKLNDLEKYYIEFYNTFDTVHGLNLTDGGNNAKHTEETKIKISNANKGKILSNATKLKISLAHKGKHLSEEAKLKIGEATRHRIIKNETRLKLKNRIISKETRKKMSLAGKGNKHNLGHKHSDESKMKMSIALKGKNLGKKHTNETKLKIGNASKGRKHTNEEKLKISNANRNRVGSYEIYNINNKLIYKFKGELKNELKKLNLPREGLCNTYRKNKKIKFGIYAGWYMIKL